MREIFYILMLFFFTNCNNSSEKNNIERLFIDNQKEFLDFKNTVLTNFENIVNSDECHPDGDKSRTTIGPLEHIKNCYSDLPKELFDEVYMFFDKFSVESIYLEQNKLILLMKYSTNIKKTKFDIIAFSCNDSLPIYYHENIILKKEIYQNWYYLVKEEPSF